MLEGLNHSYHHNHNLFLKLSVIQNNGGEREGEMKEGREGCMEGSREGRKEGKR